MTDQKKNELEWKLNLAIVGGGRGAESFLRMITGNRFKQFNFRIKGLADVRKDAPGVMYAREIGVPLITADYKELFDIENLNLIIELTGDDEVCKKLEIERPRHVKLIDSFSANLFWELLTAEEAIIRQRTNMRRQVEAERKWISQVLDSIPDEIMVIGLEGEIQYANAALLANNNLKLGDILKKNCYDVEMRRGDCSLGIGDCPLGEVLKTRESSYHVRKHYDEKGDPHYAAIVGAPMFDENGKIVGIIESTRDITHRITLEEVLKATESRLNQFMEFAPVATYIKSPDGIYMEVNDLACETFGKTRKEILGKTDLEIFMRDTAEVFRASDAEVIRTKSKMTSEKQVNLQGRVVSLSTIKYPILDTSGEIMAICGLVNDVTELRETARELSDTRDYLKNILNNSPVIIITTDLDGKIVRFNSGAEESLGYPAGEAIGTFAKDLYIDPKERDFLLRRVLNEGAVRDYETNLVCRDGRHLPVSITLSQLKNAEGEMIGTVGMSKDISHRKVLFDQIAQSERLAAVGRLASGVAHEINNPLAVISEIAGFLAEVLKRDPELNNPEFLSELSEGLPKILKEVKRCRSITSRMLSFARKTTVTEETTDVNAALDEILPFWEKKANLRHVTIHRDYDPNLPKARIEEMQLQEIFINIINNAIQAIESNQGGNIRLSTGRNSEGKITVSIKDDGPGIPQDVMDRIFDPFVTTKDAGKGTGLGLSICYGIIKRYDGKITVNSKLGEGAEFVITLAPFSD